MFNIGSMKTQPIVITVAVIVIAVCGFLFIRSKTLSSPQKGEVGQFLANFKNQLVKGNQDSLLSYFNETQRSEEKMRLVYALLGRVGKNGKEKVLFNVNFNSDDSNIKFINSELSTAVVPISFTKDSVETKFSTITFTIQKIAEHQYKIYQIDARDFMTDFLNYQNTVLQRTYSDKDIYSPITLKAFASVGNLFAKYDSVVWFGHLKGKTYFYVVKGEWNDYDDRDSAKFKMGLVNPEFKEIIPAEYSIIHNINATFSGLVEVEQGHKKGFYNLEGKIIVPVIYDNIYVVNNADNLAALRDGDNYYWLKNDYSVSEKADINIADIFAMLKQPASFTYTKSPIDDVMELNSRERHESIYLPPSYLADLNIMPARIEFKNPLRKHIEFYEATNRYQVKGSAIAAAGPPEGEESWLQTAFYSIRNYFLGGRSEFYDTGNLVVVDKRSNKIYTKSINVDYSEEGMNPLSGLCSNYHVRALTDSLFEVRVASAASIQLYDDNHSVDEMPMYHYLVLKNNKLEEMETSRRFAFTKYQKMDDSYLEGCYIYNNRQANGDWKTTQSDKLSAEVLRYMKNEIYADYHYKFKDKKWTDIFEFAGDYKSENVTVDDSLTAIDKYNINWIDSKLKATKTATLAAK